MPNQPNNVINVIYKHWSVVSDYYLPPMNEQKQIKHVTRSE